MYSSFLAFGIILAFYVIPDLFEFIVSDSTQIQAQLAFVKSDFSRKKINKRTLVDSLMIRVCELKPNEKQYLNDILLEHFNDVVPLIPKQNNIEKFPGINNLGIVSQSDKIESLSNWQQNIIEIKNSDYQYPKRIQLYSVKSIINNYYAGNEYEKENGIIDVKSFLVFDQYLIDQQNDNRHKKSNEWYSCLNDKIIGNMVKAQKFNANGELGLIYSVKSKDPQPRHIARIYIQNTECLKHSQLNTITQPFTIYQDFFKQLKSYNKQVCPKNREYIPLLVHNKNYFEIELTSSPKTFNQFDLFEDMFVVSNSNDFELFYFYQRNQYGVYEYQSQEDNLKLWKYTARFDDNIFFFKNLGLKFLKVVQDKPPYILTLNAIGNLSGVYLIGDIFKYEIVNSTDNKTSIYRWRRLGQLFEKKRSINPSLIQKGGFSLESEIIYDKENKRVLVVSHNKFLAYIRFRNSSHYDIIQYYCLEKEGVNIKVESMQFIEETPYVLFLVRDGNEKKILLLHTSNQGDQEDDDSGPDDKQLKIETNSIRSITAQKLDDYKILLVTVLDNQEIVGYIFENKIDYNYDLDINFGFGSLSGIFEIILTTIVSLIGICLCLGVRANIRISIGGPNGSIRPPINQNN